MADILNKLNRGPWLKRILVASCLLSGLFYLVEKFYILPERQQALINNYIFVLKNNLAQFHQVVGAAIDEKDYNRYFYKNSISERKLSRLQTAHRLIRHVSLLNRNGAVIGQTTQVYAAASHRKYLKRAVKTYRYQQFLDARGLHRLYPVLDLDLKPLGFILYRLAVPGAGDDSTIALFNEARNIIYLNEENYLSNAGQALLREKLQEEEMAENGSLLVSLPGQSYEINYQLATSLGLFFAGIGPAGGLTAGFFMLGLSLLTMLLYSVFSNPHLLKRLSQQDEREKIDNLLSNQKKALENLRSDFSEIKQAYSFADTELEDREKIIAGKVLDESEAEQGVDADDTSPLYSYDETALSEQVASKEIKDRATIDMKPLQREFIFLEPEDSSYKQNFRARPAFETGLSEPEKDQVSKAREKTFTPEVKRLIQEIQQPGGDDEKASLLRRIDVFEANWESVKIDEMQSYLNEVYFDEVTLFEIENLLRMIKQRMQADSMALLRYNAYLGCYETTVTYGLDDRAVENLYVTIDDSIIQMKRHEFNFQPVDDAMKENVFFQKRFGREVAIEIDSLYLLSLHDFYLDAFVMAIYNTDQGEVIARSVPEDSLRRWLGQITPALKYYFMEQFSYDITDQTNEMIKEITAVTNKGQTQAHVVHVHMKDAITAAQYENLRDVLSRVMNERERLIFNSPLLLIAMLLPGNVEPFKQVMGEELGEVTLHDFEFPRKGQSFYAYF